MHDDTDWSLHSFEAPAKAQPQAEVEKGTCPKCGKHIGKGIHFHVKACDGKSEVK